MRHETDPLVVFWTLQSKDGHMVMCAAYRVSSIDLELRVQDDRGRRLSTQVFRGSDVHLRMVKSADMTRERLIAKGLRDTP